MEIDKLGERLKKRLKDFSPNQDKSYDLVFDEPSNRYNIRAEQFPVPGLLLFLLTGICKFSSRGREEKMHWNVAFTYKKYNYAITFEKFGLRLYAEKESKIKPEEVLGKLQKALELVERKFLGNIAKQQISAGNISIENQFIKLSNQYSYFREMAETEYSSKQNSGKSGNFIEEIMNTINSETNAKRTGQYNALAMIDAYFSRLEHFLVLALPFSDYDREKDNLVEFVGSVWSDKLKRIFDVSDKNIQRHYSGLVHIKEKFRNTFAHGGFEKNGQSFYFHLPGYGAIPASMSGITNSVHFDSFPINKNGFDEICSVFDAFDQYLSTDSHLTEAWKYADSGLNLALDKQNLEIMLEAAKDPEYFEKWIEYESEMECNYINADY